MVAALETATKLLLFAHFWSLAPARQNDIWTWTSSPNPSIFWHCWLGNFLRSATACTFWTSQLPKVVGDRQFLTLLTWKCASRCNCVQLFRCHLAKWLRTCRFGEPTFQLRDHKSLEKQSVWRLCCLFFLLTLSLLWSWFFFSSHLCFPSAYIFRSLPSKTSFNDTKTP